MPVDVSQILFGDSDVPNESLVQIFIERIRKGQGIPKPVLAKDKNGRAVIVHGQEQIEAARRMGETTFDTYIIEGEFSPDALQKLRRELKQARPNN
jgi:hypothetical protein